MTQILEWLRKAVEEGASDIFIGTGRCISFKINGNIAPVSGAVALSNDVERMVSGLYDAAKRDMNKYKKTGDDDFPISIQGLARFRVNTYRQRGTMAAHIRIVLIDIPNYKDIHIPEEVIRISSERHGLVLFSGPAGSGKTTTLACLIDAVNKTRNCHIITLEDPIEYLHRDDKSIISQREIATDTESYLTALRASLRQAPDVIQLGEMRDYETIGTAMTAAETGHLVISTLHTVGAVNTVDRIIDVFPPSQQQQVRVQLSALLKTVVSQKLLPCEKGGLIPAFEIMHVNNAIRNLIREEKNHQIDTVIQTSGQKGMISMDASIVQLFEAGLISADAAVNYSVNHVQMAKRVSLT